MVNPYLTNIDPMLESFFNFNRKKQPKSPEADISTKGAVPSSMEEAGGIEVMHFDRKENVHLADKLDEFFENQKGGKDAIGSKESGRAERMH